MFPKLFYATAPVFVLLPSAVLLAAILLAIVCRRKAAAVHQICLLGLIVATASPWLCVAGQALQLRQWNVPTAFNSPIIFGRHIFTDSAPAPDSQMLLREISAPHDMESSGDSMSHVGSTLSASNWRWTLWMTFDLLFSIWLLGTVVCLARMATSIGRLFGLVAQTKPIHFDQNFTPEIIGRIERMRVRLRTHQELSSPVALSFPARMIVVPEEMLSPQNCRQRLERVVLHELAHVARRDQYFLLVSRLVTALYWFNPLFHVVSQWLENAAESVCDDWVLAEKNAADYCRDLVAIATVPNRRVQVMASGMGSGRSIARRVTRLLSPARIASLRTSPPFRASTLGLAFAMGFVGLHLKPGETRSILNQDEIISMPPMEDWWQLFNSYKHPQRLVAEVIDLEKNPVPAARVVLVENNSQLNWQRIVCETVTDEKGTFTFDLGNANIADHNGLVVVVSKQGHGADISPLYADPRYIAAPENWKIVLPKLSTSLSGKVVDENGQPLSGVDVWYSRGAIYSPIAGVLSAKTDPEGQFSIEGLDNSISGLPIVVRDSARGQRQYLLDGSQPLEIELPPGVSVSGLVVNDSQRPVAGRTVYATATADSPIRAFDTATTDANGNYQLSLFENCSYDLNVVNELAAVQPKPPMMASTQSVSLVGVGNSIKLADFCLVRAVKITGTVWNDETGKAIQPDNSSPTPSVAFYGRNPKEFSNSPDFVAPISSEDGSYEAWVLPGTVYSVFVSGYDSKNQRPYFRDQDNDELFKNGIHVGPSGMDRVDFWVIVELKGK